MRSVVSGAVPDGFTETLVVSGLTSPTSMAIATDDSGRIFVCEKGGAIRIIKDGALLAASFHTLTVDNNQSRGLLGIAFDPNFASSQFIYVYYTATIPSIHNRVSRLTANGDVILPNSELILLEIDHPVGSAGHSAGAIHFGKDGKLYIAVGDNSNPANSQTLDNLYGKMLRINTDGSIPTDNPFYNMAIGVNQAIWALGLRNPFTFAVQPETGRILINDVGEGSWEEINDQPPEPLPSGFPNPRNYGWSLAEGSAMCSTYLCPLFAYPHSGGSFNGCAITGGIFYNPTTQQFPAEYQGNYFFADHCGGWIRKLELSNGTVTSFATTVVSYPVDLDIDSDGNLYYLARGGGNSTGVIYKIQYQGDQAPTITTHPTDKTVTVGASPTFSVIASGTPPLNYQWQRNNVDITGANSNSYTLNNAQLADSGAQFRCVATNSFGYAMSNPAQLTVTDNHSPVALISLPANGSLYNAGQTISYSGSSSDPDEGDISANGFTWWVDFHHSNQTDPHILPVSGIKSGSFSIPASGETDINQWYRIYLRVTDSGNLQNTTYVDIFPRKATIALASNPSGLQLRLDGQNVTTPYSFVSVVGMTRSIGAISPQTVGGNTYNFVSWSDGKAALHNITTPGSNTTYTATFGTGGVQTGDGLSATYFNLKTLSGTTKTRIDPTVNFNWYTSAPISGIDPETFSVRWTGFVQPKYNQTYTFRTTTNDGVRLWINGVRIINAWVNLAGVRTGTFALKAETKYSIVLEYYEDTGNAKCVLEWSSPSQVRQVIPKAQLYSK